MKKKAVIDTASCVGCGCCVKVCPMGAVSVPLGIHAVINPLKCVGCGRCAAECPASIIEIIRQEVAAHA